MLRSLLRIAVAVLALAALGFGALAYALRQPVLIADTWRGTVHADPSELEKHVRFLTEDARPRAGANLARAARYIESRFRAAGGRTSSQKFGTYENVITEFGPDRGAVLVIGAHYDAFSETGPLPGADDNASGTAGLLELARLLGESHVQHRIMLVAYANEEPPFFGSELMGSAIHAQSLEGTDVRGMICLEMIGYFSEQQTWPNPLFAAIYPNRGDFIGVAGGWSDRRLARAVKRAMSGASDLAVVSFSGPRETSDASDHRNYWSHGWPAVMITDTAFLRNPNYHTSRDTAATLDYRRMARVVDGVWNAATGVR
ncbi:MAG TPA: M28 family peptidase [Thermoanaerobaculia bacterium]|nr:M28 family peptidase [Thermoanaerobaculia bacterium]